ncbi:hypothetical protein Hgul01_00432 [Herpetosiphon gulosus]|uniref:Uncharacterized protein n=1 Tax=Herpetosiphon gulosus TaxID=1973496 RepID=A0ABP9WW04_9CHLR
MVYRVNNGQHALTPGPPRPHARRGGTALGVLPSPAAVGEGLGVRERALVANPMNHYS